MRPLLFALSLSALSACVSGAEPAPGTELKAQSEVAQRVCEDAWECWCNTLSTRTSCTNATKGGWHCWWEGPAAAAAATASLGVCHATYE